MPLSVGNLYTRVEVQEALDIPNPTFKGKWGTGYTTHDRQFYIFANIGGAGRTGHDYPNEWNGDSLHWCAKSGTHAGQAQMRLLLQAGTKSHVFTRHGDRDRFVYHGVAKPTDPRGRDPLMVTWVFSEPASEIRRRGNPGPGPAPQRPSMYGAQHGRYRRAKAPTGVEKAVVEEGVLRRNPALVERALRGHAHTQNALADELAARNLTPLSPTGTVDYDLAWPEEGGIAVAEVKSITEANQVAQLRSGLGQLLDYAAGLEHAGERVHRLVLVLEREPCSPDHWRRACARAGVQLTWAPGFTGL